MNYFGKNIQIFDPCWYYLGRLDYTDREQISILFKDFIEDKDNFKTPNIWNSIQSSYYHKNNDKAPWDKWLDIIGKQLDLFVKEVGTTQPIEIRPYEAWVNKYYTGDSQEYHDHCTPNTNISLVYFHTLNDNDDCQFMFRNESSKYQLTGLSDLLTIPNQQYTVPEVKEGSVIIFPSFYPHLVSQHKGKRERITFAANYSMLPSGYRDK